MISISGVFAVTFSVVFAYVADVTTTEDRSKAYGLVSATFAASLVCILGSYVFSMFQSIKSKCLLMHVLLPIPLGHISGTWRVFA